MKNMHGFMVMAVFVVALSFTGCEADSKETTIPSSPFTGVTVSPSMPNIARGDQEQFTATVDID